MEEKKWFTWIWTNGWSRVAVQTADGGCDTPNNKNIIYIYFITERCMWKFSDIQVEQRSPYIFLNFFIIAICQQLIKGPVCKPLQRLVIRNNIRHSTPNVNPCLQKAFLHELWFQSKIWRSWADPCSATVSEFVVVVGTLWLPPKTRSLLHISILIVNINTYYYWVKTKIQFLSRWKHY